MLIKSGESCLLLIDMQERLLAAMPAADGLVRNCERLLRGATALDVPVLASEQYPTGLGSTVASLASLVPRDATFAKVDFSCFADAYARSRIAALDRRQMVLAGMEAHVCVTQTALALALAGYDVFVVADASMSRSDANHRAAMDRLRDSGIAIVTTEMVLFEWLARANTDAFRALLPLIR